MLVAAAIIGLLTAYYLGVRAGMMAAAGSALCFIAAMVIPGASIWAYGIVAVGVLGVCLIGPRVQKKGSKDKVMGLVKKGVRQAIGLVRKLG